MDPTVYVPTGEQHPDLPRHPTYIGVCCREWPLAMGFPVGRCGICGERPVKKADD